MREVQASEAKTHLPQLLDDVERGETIVITRHGRPIARLVPDEDRRQAERAQAIAAIKALRRARGKDPASGAAAMRGMRATNTDGVCPRRIRHGLSGRLEDEENAVADVALAAARREPAYVPSIWWFEIRNVLLINERRQRITERDTASVSTVAAVTWIIEIDRFTGRGWHVSRWRAVIG